MFFNLFFDNILFLEKQAWLPKQVKSEDDQQPSRPSANNFGFDEVYASRDDVCIHREKLKPVQVRNQVWRCMQTFADVCQKKLDYVTSLLFRFIK